MQTETYLPTTIEIDGAEVPLRILRFDYESRTAFARDMDKLRGIWQRATALTRLALVTAGLPTKPETEDATEHESAEDQAARLARNAVALRTHAENIQLALALRELADTPAERAKRDEVSAENDAFSSRFIREAFERFVSVDPAYDLVDLDGRSVRTGADLLRSYPSVGMYSVVLAKIETQNSLAAELKKKLASRSDSAPLSLEKSEMSQTANGGAPAPIAGDASTPATAALAGVAG